MVIDNRKRIILNKEFGVFEFMGVQFRIYHAYFNGVFSVKVMSYDKEWQCQQILLRLGKEMNFKRTIMSCADAILTSINRIHDTKYKR